MRTHLDGGASEPKGLGAVEERLAARLLAQRERVRGGLL